MFQLGTISEKLKIWSVTPWSCNYLYLYWFLCRNLLANYSSFIFLSFIVHLSTISWAEFTVRKDVHHFERVLVKTFYFHLPLSILIVEAYFQLPWFNEKTVIKYDPSSNVLFVLSSNNLWTLFSLEFSHSSWFKICRPIPSNFHTSYFALFKSDFDWEQ